SRFSSLLFNRTSRAPTSYLTLTLHDALPILIDLGDRFRLIINDVNCKKTEKPMPKLPVATAFWTPEPNLQTGAEAWILCGGAHRSEEHTSELQSRFDIVCRLLLDNTRDTMRT